MIKPSLKVGILAAGKGSRLGCEDTPKPLLTIKDKPMIHKLVETLYSIGFDASSIFCVTGFLGQKIKDYFNDDLTYLEQSHLNGNAGAVEVIIKNLQSKDDFDLLVVQGDDAEYVDSEQIRKLIDIHHVREADITVVLTNVPDESVHNFEFSIFEGRVKEIKPRITRDSTGRYLTGVFLFKSSVLRSMLPKLKERTALGKELGIMSLLQISLQDGLKVYCLETSILYISINTREGLERARFLARK